MKYHQKGYEVDIPATKKAAPQTRAIAYVRYTSHVVWQSEPGTFTECQIAALQWLEQAEPLTGGPYSDEQIAKGKVLVGDTGAIYGYAFQVQQHYEDLSPGVFSTSTCDLPCFDTETAAIQYLNEQPFPGAVMRYTRTAHGLRSWITAGKVYRKSEGERDYWKARVQMRMTNPPEFAFGRNYWVVRRRDGDKFSWICEATFAFPAASCHFGWDYAPVPVGTLRSFQFTDVDKYETICPACLLPEVVAEYEAKAGEKFGKHNYWAIRLGTPTLPGEIGDHRRQKAFAFGNTPEQAEAQVRLAQHWDESVPLKIVTERELKEDWL